MIPYNPSSFNSNKTILEQILEIKKWLIAHPSYKVYYCTSNFMPTGDDDRAFTEIAGTEEEVQNIAVGDLLVFPDAYYSEVIAVDLDNEMVTIALPATNFSGPQGATGPQGADGTNGTNGTCIRYCNTNKNSNPSTTYAVTDITFSTGLQINDCILFKNNRIGFVDNISGGTFRVTGNIIIDGKDGQYVDSATINSDGDLIITLYDPESMIQTNINAGHVVGSDGNDGVSITNVAIDGNQHLIVTLSSGSTIDAGSVSSGAEVIDPADPSYRVLTSSEMDKFKTRNLYIYTNGHCYSFDWESSTYIFGTYLYYNGSSNYNMNRIRITKSTGDWQEGTMLSLSNQVTSLGSSGATNGQVLMADGNGNCAWQTPSGSGPELVTISGATGTISASDLTKLDNGAIIYSSSAAVFYYKYGKYSTPQNYYYISFTISPTYVNSSSLVINASTGAYTTSYTTLYAKPTANQIDSTGATSGQVLTANGLGGASWQTPSGGLNVYNFSKQLNTDANRKQLYNIIDNAKSIKYIQDDDGKTYNIYTGLNQFRIIGFDAFASGVTKYVYILNSTGTSTSGTQYNADGTSSSISISGRSFECKYYNDSEITS